MNASGDGAWEWNITSGELRMSQGFLVSLGYRSRDLPVGIEGLRSLVHPADRDRLKADLDAHLNGERALYESEYRVRTVDGRWIWNRDRGRVVAWTEDGSPARMVGTGRDVTAEKDALERARETAELLALAQRGAGAGTWDLDLRTNRVGLCARSRQMLGLPPGTGELEFEEWAARIHPDDIQTCIATIHQTAAERGEYALEFRAYAAEGTRWILGLGQAICDASGEPERFVGLNLDITDRKAQEEALRRAEAELLQLSRLTAMGTMGSMLAHELNQPLTAIGNYLTAIRRMIGADALTTEPRIGQAIARAEDCVKRAGDIIRRLRQYVAGGKLQAREESVEPMVRETAAIALDTVRPAVALDLDLDPAAATILGDRVQIQQVLTNLLRNAVEAMAGCRRRTIRISSRVADAQLVELRVTDSGAGVSEDLAETLFSPFVTTKPDGMGIGLAICRTIIEAHGGRIWAEPAPGGGTSLCFTLPRGV